MSVFAIPLLDCWLVHAPLLRISAVINRAAHRELSTDPDCLDPRLAEMRAALEEVPSEIPQPLRGAVSPHFSDWCRRAPAI